MNRQPIESNDNCKYCNIIKEKMNQDEAINDYTTNAWFAGLTIQRRGIFNIEYPNTYFVPKIDFLKKIEAMNHQYSLWCKECGFIVDNKTYIKEYDSELEFSITFFNGDSSIKTIDVKTPSTLQLNADVSTHKLIIYNMYEESETKTIESNLNILDFCSIVTTKKGFKIIFDDNQIFNNQTTFSFMFNKNNILNISEVDEFDVVQVATYNDENLMTNHYIGYVELNQYSSTINRTNDIDKSFSVIVTPIVEEVIYRNLLYAWGKNTNGQLGDGTFINKDTATLTMFNQPELIKNTKTSSIGLNQDGLIYVWGSNQYGQLGFNDKLNRNEPTFLNLQSKYYINSKIIDVSLGWFFTTLLDSSGYVWSFGRNNFGQLGNKQTIDTYIPQKVQTDSGDLQKIKSISSNTDFSIAIDEDDFVWKWGGKKIINENLIVYNKAIKTETKDGEFKAVKAVAGGYHSLALKQDETVWSLGYNFSGQIGIGESSDNSDYQDDEKSEYIKWIQVLDIANVKQINAGLEHSVALDDNKNVWTWGNNQYGQIGDGNITIPYKLNKNKYSPYKIQKSIAYFYKANINFNGTWSFTPPFDLDTNQYYIDIYIENEKFKSNTLIYELNIVEEDDEEKTNNDSSVTANESNITFTIPKESILKTTNKKPTISGTSIGAKSTDYIYFVFYLYSFDGVENIVCGENNNIAIKENGSVWFWGNNVWNSGKSKFFPIYDDFIVYPTQIHELKNKESFSIGEESIFYIEKEQI